MIDILKNCQKLIVTVVSRDKTARVVKASKRKRAEGATIMHGQGTGIEKCKTFWGIPLEPEKDVIFTVVSDEHAEEVLDIISKSVKMSKPGNGVAFILDITRFTGAVHLHKKKNKPEDLPLKAMDETAQFELIVTIVDKGFCEEIITASRKAGAAGGTIITGRGTGVHERGRLLSFNIEPEKEVILTLVPQSITDEVLETIVKTGELDKPGKGIAFVLNVEKVLGINHLVQDMLHKHKQGNGSGE
ncbi:P-II family nitrogen regulator [Balneolales bacterium ANBcel1]|nr:P-II family nitrogen regulator [Balneolales bacterium ANBcel1]